MTANLSLLLCTAFVFIALGVERKQMPDVSHALWIPTIWMLLIASKPLGIWFKSSPGSHDAGSFLDRTFLIGLLVVGFFMLMSRQTGWSNFKKDNPWLLLLFFYMLISIIWSDIQFISFKRWTRELVAIVMALLVLTEQNPRHAMYSILRRSAYILIPFSILLINYFPEYGRQYGRWSGELMWTGVAMQKNGLGRLCLISAFFLIWSYVRRKKGHEIVISKYLPHLDLLILIMTFWLLKGPGNAYSATSLAVLAIALMFFGFLLWTKKHRVSIGKNILLIVMTFFIVCGTFTAFNSGALVGSFTGALGRDTTLTGRTDIWANLTLEAMEQPLLGGGFGSFWTMSNRERHKVSEAHNGYLEVILGLGFVGLILISFFILSSCSKAHRELYYDFDWASLWLCFLLMSVLHNFTESSLNSFTSHLTAIILFFTIISTKHPD